MNARDKCVAVVASCKTTEQLDCAHRYIKLARKSNKLGRDCFHLLWGTISALKGIHEHNKGANNG